jgi:cytoplasmic FMR1 interacting protein
VEDILQVLIVFCVESLELDFALLFPERHTLLRVLPVLVVLATSSEKESESLYRRVKINRLLSIFKVCLTSTISHSFIAANMVACNVLIMNK